MGMHIAVKVRHRPASFDLGYWEGDPPAIGDIVEGPDGTLYQVEGRLWHDYLRVTLQVRRHRG